MEEILSKRFVYQLHKPRLTQDNNNRVLLTVTEMEQNLEFFQVFALNSEHRNVWVAGNNSNNNTPIQSQNNKCADRPANHEAGSWSFHLLVDACEARPQSHYCATPCSLLLPHRSSLHTLPTGKCPNSTCQFLHVLSQSNSLNHWKKNMLPHLQFLCHLFWSQEQFGL